ncbi:hypothetical protein ZWY2020_051571 [Hordeum vulgare]|nr:hypothetical protein ZWY2020_051571 [Hordeum vulgare]
MISRISSISLVSVLKSYIVIINLNISILISLSWEINEKEIRIENIAPFGVSFTKCLIDHHPVMPCCHSKFHPSCRTHQTRM